MAESAAVSFGGGFAGVAGSSHCSGQGAGIVAEFARRIGSTGGKIASDDEEESTRHVADGDHRQVARGADGADRRI